MATYSKKGEKKTPGPKKKALQILPKKEKPSDAQKSERSFRSGAEKQTRLFRSGAEKQTRLFRSGAEKQTRLFRSGAEKQTPLYNADLVYQVARAKMLNKKRPLASTKDRAEVSGSGRKPWPQKGTGRSRHGSIRSPLWRGGGVTFGPRKERNYQKGVTKKMANTALAMVFQKKSEEEEIKKVESIVLEEYRTKYFARWLKDLIEKEKASVIVVSVKDTQLLKRAGRNIPGVTVRAPENVDVLDLLSHRYCIITSDASKRLMARAMLK